MAKFNKNNYNFIDLTENDFHELSSTELDKAINDTKGILFETSKSITKVILNMQLVSGLLAVRGGEFKKANIFTVKADLGNVTKEEKKLIKKVFTKVKWYYRLKVIIVLITKNQQQTDTINPILALKK